jgi:membrane associated rhomboid family serine protease
MGLYDRDYTKEYYRSSRGMLPIRFGFSPVTPVVKWLLITNIASFVTCFLINPLAQFCYTWFSVFPATIGMSLQPWRLITYQFLHSIHGFGHIFWNMLMLYYFGCMIERLWGPKKFLTFYLLCGATGGLLYPFLALGGWLKIGPLIGASGAILGVLVAAAFSFPNQIINVMGIFPLRVRTLALILAGISILSVLRPWQVDNAGGEAAHLGGMAAGAIYVMWRPWLKKFKEKDRVNRWESDIARQRALEMEVDRILKKVHESGIHSLTRQEKKTLEKATKAEQMRNRS